MKERYNVIYCGTPEFAVPTLDALANHPNINLLAIVTPPSKAAGRGLQQLCAPPVAERAVTLNIPLLQSENINNDIEKLRALTPANEQIDLIIVLAFCQFLKGEILSLPTLGCFNIHASLLPKYRGAAPIQHAILSGDTITGITIQKMVKKMDAGDVVHTETTTIAPHETGGELALRLQALSATAITSFIDKIKKNALLATPQVESLVTYAPSLYRDDGAITKELLQKSSAEAIYNRIRAFNPWPGTFCHLNCAKQKQQRLKIISAQIVSPAEIPSSAHPAPGHLCTEKWLLLGSADRPIRLTQVQLEGKKVCKDSELLNGIRGELTLE
ncbi:MAG: methionyl-tRNA formyltransferase [Oligoflexia bacterium]|nr:methionyl-tRNA formyltransferase [Oligoflexia bacterium]MBF0365554.1 methionyl-tRNA formyltransferase [Oligoflexia bacterium]